MNDLTRDALDSVAVIARQVLASEAVDTKTRSLAEAFLAVYADIQSKQEAQRHGGQNKLDLPEAHIVKEYASGKSAAEIAAENECSRASIIRVLKAHGVEIRRGRPRGK